MNEIVKYDNYMNGLKFSGFSTVDFNFFMALCSRMRDKDINELMFTFEELRNITGYKQASVKKFVSDLERMNEKLMKMTCKIRTETKTIMFVLFPTFITDAENQTLTIAVNERFKFILNEILKNFTRFDLDEFVQLDSKYSKNLYRLLKQFRTTGKYQVGIYDFREKMDCPESYSNKYVMNLIIKPSLQELQAYFENLSCTVQYARKRGRPVTGYIFTFKPESNGIRTICNQKENKKAIKNKKNSNFHQREYDYEELEKKLLKNQLAGNDEMDIAEITENQQESENIDPNIAEMLKNIRK